MNFAFLAAALTFITMTAGIASVMPEETVPALPMMEAEQLSKTTDQLSVLDQFIQFIFTSLIMIV